MVVAMLFRNSQMCKHHMIITLIKYVLTLGRCGQYAKSSVIQSASALTWEEGEIMKHKDEHQLRMNVSVGLLTAPEQLVNIDSGLASHWGCWWTSKHLVSLQGELILLLCMGGCWRVDAKPGLWTEIHIYWLWPMCIDWKFNGQVWSTVNQLYRACKWCQKSYLTSINSP